MLPQPDLRGFAELWSCTCELKHQQLRRRRRHSIHSDGRDAHAVQQLQEGEASERPEAGHSTVGQAACAGQTQLPKRRELCQRLCVSKKLLRD